ncbi:MAG TPA: hypothetical protein PK992_16835 [Planctomycetaceae bacterium]|nr:hypothetical protein [Planctomycetaceae bacterium]HRA89756.1 hypothetical protein [Planctomycetaceae bacterium]
MKNLIPTLLLTFGVLITATETSRAIAPFKKAFEEKYVKSSDNDDFKAAFKKGGCNVCHAKDQKKDWLNAYGLALAKNIPGSVKERLDKAKAEGAEASKAENEKLLEELKAAFEKAEETKSPSETTFGAMFKDHKLPTDEGARSVNDPEPAEGDAAKAK